MLQLQRNSIMLTGFTWIPGRMDATFKSKKHIFLILVSLLIFVVTLLNPTRVLAYQVPPNLNSPTWDYIVPNDSKMELKKLTCSELRTLENQSKGSNYKKFKPLLYNNNFRPCLQLKSNLQISNNLDIFSIQKMFLITAFVLFYFNKLKNSKKKQIIVEVYIRDINRPENFAVLINDVKCEIYLLKGSIGRIVSVSHDNPFKCQVSFQLKPPIYALENSKDLNFLCSEALTFSKNNPVLKKLFNS